MELKEKRFSKVDKTIKYLFKNQDGIEVEFSYINKDDGKDIICVPSQSTCMMGCKFCFLTALKGELKYRNLIAEEISDTVKHILSDLDILNNNKQLLISYMGAGEPLMNHLEVFRSMLKIGSITNRPVRFALATIFPKNKVGDFTEFTNLVKDKHINVKLHYSMHFTRDDIRSEYMPNGMPIKEALHLMRSYRNITGNNLEIHYFLADGINDTEQDIQELTEIVHPLNIPVKILYYSQNDNLHFVDSVKVKEFQTKLEKGGLKVEFYRPPGYDIGAACGQFFVERVNKGIG
jgi:adenine C2-methylase RlmN of 23S rRNA A2503 and tRNA A37